MSVYNGSHGYFSYRELRDLLGGAVTRTLNEGGTALEALRGGNMSFHLLLTLLQLQLGKSSTRLLLFLLCLHACDNCGRVYCSVARLAKEMNAHPRNVKTLLQKLIKDKVIEQKDEHGPHNTNVYELVGVKSHQLGSVKSPKVLACKHHPITIHNQEKKQPVGHGQTDDHQNLLDGLLRLLGREGAEIYGRLLEHSASTNGDSPHDDKGNSARVSD